MQLIWNLLKWFVYVAGGAVGILCVVVLSYGCVMRIVHHPTTIDAEITSVMEKLSQWWRIWREHHQKFFKTRKKMSSGQRFMRSCYILLGVASLIPILACVEAFVLKSDVEDNLELAITCALLEMACLAGVYEIKLKLDTDN